MSFLVNDSSKISSCFVEWGRRRRRNAFESNLNSIKSCFKRQKPTLRLFLIQVNMHAVLICSHLTCYLLLFTLLNLVVQSFSPSKTETLEDEVRSESGLTYDVVNASFQEELPDFVMCSRPTVTTQERDASTRLSDQYRLVFSVF